MIATAAE